MNKYFLKIFFISIFLFFIVLCVSPQTTYAANEHTTEKTFTVTKILSPLTDFITHTATSISSFVTHAFAFTNTNKTPQSLPKKFATTSYVLGTNAVVDISDLDARVKALTSKYNTLVTTTPNTRSGVGSSPNLLRNSSFEESSNGSPLQWYDLLDSTPANTSVSTEGIHSGSYGLKFAGGGSGNFAISQPTIKTVPQRTYTFSAWVKAINTPNVTIKLGFWNEQFNQEGAMRAVSFSGTKDWTRITMTTTTPGIITDSVNEFPLIEVLGLTNGAVYLDDAKLEEGTGATLYNSADASTGNLSSGNGATLTSPSGDLYPAVSESNSLGLSTNPWTALYLSKAVIDANGNFNFNGGGTVNGSLTVNQGINVASNSALAVSGQANFNGQAIFNNTTTFNGQTYNWPSSGQTSGYVLTTDGSGNLSWGAVASSNLLSGNVTLGTNSSNTLTINSLLNSTLNPSSTSVNLGSSGFNFGTVYAQNLVLSGTSGTDGFWQLNSGVLSPATSSNTLAIGTTTPLANSGIDIEQNGLGNSVLVANQTGSGDIFTASKSGSTKFVINSNGYAGIGNAAPNTPLQISTTVPDTSTANFASDLYINGTMASTTNGQYGLRASPSISPGSASTQTYTGIYGGALSSSTNLSGATIQGLQTNPFYNGAGTLGSGIGGFFKVTAANNSSIITNSLGIQVQGAAQSGCTTCSFTNNAGMQIFNQTLGTNNSNLILGGSTTSIPGGNFSIYNSSTYNNYFAGSLGIGTTSLGNAELVVKQPNSSGDILSASSSGSTVFTIANNGNLTASGNFALNGGSLTTTQTTANIFNTTPTTINFGGVATTLNLGATSGTTSIKNNLSVSGTTTFNNLAYTWPSAQAASQVLQTDGNGNLSWVTSGATNYWQLNSGILSPAIVSNTLSVGTTNSLGTLDIRSLNGTQPIATISGSTSFAALNVDNSGTGDLFTASKSGGTKFVLTNSGNVGIGTNIPTSLLHLNNSTNALANVGLWSSYNLFLQNSDSTNNNGTGIGFTDTNAGGINNVGGSIIFKRTGSNSQGELQFYTKQSTSALAAPVQAMVMSNAGNVGIGTTAPNYRLDTMDTQNATSSASITNLSTSDTANTNVLALNLGTATTGTNARFIQFFAGANSSKNAVGVGRIQLNNGNVAYNTGGADFAEYFSKGTTPLTQGDIVTIDTSGSATLATQKTGAIGIVSKTAGFVGNAPHDETQEAQKVVVGLVGQLPVKVTTENGTIQAGDLLTMSATPGVAMKGTKAGTMIGRALENYTNTDVHATGTIQIVITISYADPTMQFALTDSGDLSINGQAPGTNTPLTTNGFVANSTPSSVQPAGNPVTADQFTSLSATVSGMQSQIASMSSQFSKLDDLSKQLADLEKTVNLNQALAGISTQSAVLGASTINEDTIIGGKLSVSGRALLGDVGITGVVNDGLLTINGMDTSSATPAATINTLSAPLKMQSLATAGVDFENGKLTIDTDGNLVTQGDITAKTVKADQYEVNASGDNTSIGEATIPAGKTSVEIKTTAITDTSRVFVTSEIKGSGQLYVTSKLIGKSFKVELDNPINKDDKFNWWIVNEK